MSASTQGGPTLYQTFTSPEGATPVLNSGGGCATATGYAGVSASFGAVSMLVHASGAGVPAQCVAQADGHGNVGYGDDFRVQAPGLPAGTPVTIELCVRALGLATQSFNCAGSVFDGTTTTAQARVVLSSAAAGQRVADGSYGGRLNCYDPPGDLGTGLLSGPTNVLLSLPGVPVGSTVTFSVSTSAATSMGSLGSDAFGAYRMALVFGYSAPAGVRLVSIATGQELSPIGNCTTENLNRWLPPPPGTLLAAVPPPVTTPGAPRLLPPTPNPAPGAVGLPFVLSAPGRIGARIFDARGALVARIGGGEWPAGSGALTWNGRRDDGTPAPDGIYFARPEGVTSQSNWRFVLRR